MEASFWNVMMERVNLQGGRDDAYESSPASRQRFHNGACHRNVHMSGFSPTINDPSAQFNNKVAGYEGLNQLTDAIANSFIPIQQNTIQQTLIDIFRNYHETTNLMQDSSLQRQPFYIQALAVLDEEMIGISSGRNNDGSDPNHNNGSMNDHGNWLIDEISCPITTKLKLMLNKWKKLTKCKKEVLLIIVLYMSQNNCLWW